MDLFLKLFSPEVAYASVDSFIVKVNAQIINPIIRFLFVLAFAYFFYGMYEFIANASNDEKRSTGKSHMLWGIVGLTIMFGVWFLLGVVLSTFNLDSQINPEEGEVNLPPFHEPSP